MLQLGSFAARNCRGLSRRAFLRAGTALPLAGLATQLAGTAKAAESPRTRGVLLVWLWGGPSHLDLFDPKPDAPVEYRGPLATIDTRTPGVQFTELVPRIAARSDRLSIVRSNQNPSGDHLIAGSAALTGGEPAGSVYAPNFGSIAGRHLGYGKLPPFISVGRGPLADGRAPMDGYGGGVWGKAFDPFLVNCSEAGDVEVPALTILEGLTPLRLDDRRTLLATLDERRQQIDTAQRAAESAGQQQWDEIHRQAFDLLRSPDARRALDLSEESPQTRQAYGRSSFGQSLLLGRRLIESGVPYVQVNWSQFVEVGPPPYDFGWDTHSHHYPLMIDRHGPIFDRAFSALLDDFDQRGLWDETLLVCMGEFSRTPRINNLASRDHWPACYFSLWGGGGVQAGRVVGESDPRGEQPVTEPITPAMVGTTMLELVGVGAQARAELQVLDGGRVIHELL